MKPGKPLRRAPKYQFFYNMKSANVHNHLVCVHTYLIAKFPWVCSSGSNKQLSHFNIAFHDVHSQGKACFKTIFLNSGFI